MGDVIFPGSAVVKNRLPMQKAQEMQVRSLGGKYPEEKKTATHSSILAWGIPWTEKAIIHYRQSFSFKLPGSNICQTQYSNEAS